MRIALALVALLVGSAGAEAKTFKLCSHGMKPVIAEMISENDGAVLVLTVGKKITKFEYGGSQFTGSGVSLWFPVAGGGDFITQDYEGRITWNGRTYRDCSR